MGTRNCEISKTKPGFPKCRYCRFEMCKKLMKIDKGKPIDKTQILDPPKNVQETKEDPTSAIVTEFTNIIHNGDYKLVLDMSRLDTAIKGILTSVIF